MIVSGTVRLPGDKSITHRALLLSAGPGLLHVRGRAHLARRAGSPESFRQLGRKSPASARQRGRVQGRARFRRPEATLAGNSGTTTRLLLGSWPRTGSVPR
jgi:3-phosphoshikimate 1-carboxyvinyltransferase